jgi:hypothetical protein
LDSPALVLPDSAVVAWMMMSIPQRIHTGSQLPSPSPLVAQ